jgi:hypothetical protein
MNRNGTVSMAEPIAQLQRQVEEHRRMRPRRAKLPESIWEAAAELAREHGVYAVAQPLWRSRCGWSNDPFSNRVFVNSPVFVEVTGSGNLRPARLFDDQTCHPQEERHPEHRLHRP